MQTEDAHDPDADALRAELVRLQELVGPSEKSYIQLNLDILAARDHAIGTEAELGELRWRLDATERSLEAASVRVEQLSQMVAELQARVTEADCRLVELRSSRTWRVGRLVTAPLAAARRLVRGT